MSNNFKYIKFIQQGNLKFVHISIKISEDEKWQKYYIDVNIAIGYKFTADTQYKFALKAVILNTVQKNINDPSKKAKTSQKYINI